MLFILLYFVFYAYVLDYDIFQFYIRILQCNLKRNSYVISYFKYLRDL